MSWVMVIGILVGFILGMFITKNWLYALLFALAGFLVATGVVTLGFNPAKLLEVFR